ncbi:hypothetical protein D3C84_429890 [compost metagenome]
MRALQFVGRVPLFAGWLSVMLVLEAFAGYLRTFLHLFRIMTLVGCSGSENALNGFCTKLMY